MNRFKFRLSLVGLLRGIAAQDTAASQLRQASLWLKEYYLPGFEPERRIAEAYAAELAAFNRCFSTAELRALEQFNRVIAAWSTGATGVAGGANRAAPRFARVAQAAVRALEVFQIPQPATDRARDYALRPWKSYSYRNLPRELFSGPRAS